MVAFNHVYYFRVPCSCLYVNGKGCADAERPIDIDPFTWYLVAKQIEGSICCYQQQMWDSLLRQNPIMVLCNYRKGVPMRKPFTPEEQSILAANPYTYKVTSTTISFTLEFKKLYYERRSKGMLIRDIFISLNYDPDILGQSRMEGISHLINRAMKKEGHLWEGTRPHRSILDEDSPKPTEENFQRMFHELQYMKQEMDFIKKIISATNDSGK